MDAKSGIIAVVLLAAVMMTGCQQSDMPQENAVYYWRTEWRTDSVELAFLQQYHINKIYCRYFDVVMNSDGEPMPNATIRFVQNQLANMKLIPTVFITEDCMHKAHNGLAKKLVDRIVQMNETNDITGVDELQIDCDYTARSRKTYYDFLQAVRDEAKKHGIRLSTTIRLHQLSMPVPPADYGVLMIYNTGDPNKFNERNPILDIRDVQPYLRYLADYELPLAAAYPTFRWIRNYQNLHLEHAAEPDEILKVKEAMEKKRPELRNTILTYHLDKDNINHYKPETYEAIYHH
jgi:hypothetical protein